MCIDPGARRPTDNSETQSVAYGYHAVPTTFSASMSSSTLMATCSAFVARNEPTTQKSMRVAAR